MRFRVSAASCLDFLMLDLQDTSSEIRCYITSNMVLIDIKLKAQIDYSAGSRARLRRRAFLSHRLSPDRLDLEPNRIRCRQEHEGKNRPARCAPDQRIGQRSPKRGLRERNERQH